MLVNAVSGNLFMLGASSFQRSKGSLSVTVPRLGVDH